MGIGGLVPEVAENVEYQDLRRERVQLVQVAEGLGTRRVCALQQDILIDDGGAIGLLIGRRRARSKQELPPASIVRLLCVPNPSTVKP